jgi:hypothetical protein
MVKHCLVQIVLAMYSVYCIMYFIIVQVAIWYKRIKTD